MKRPWKMRAPKLPEIRVLKEKKPLSYWTIHIIFFLAGLELVFIIARLLR
jgi:hypothetical protein